MKRNYGIKHKGLIIEKGDMLEKCPIEGNIDTIFLGISEEDGELYMNFFADGEGYRYTLEEAKKEWGIKNIEIVKIK